MLMKNKHVVNSNLEADFALMQKWFHENQMVTNPRKCYYMLISNHDEPDKVNLNATETTSGNNEIQLGVFIDKKLTFDLHMNSLCKKAGQKLSALSKISSYLTLDQKFLLINSIMSKFSYRPLMWMFCSRSLNISLNHVHERALRLIYDDHAHSFQGILEMTNETTIYKKNLECLAKETSITLEVTSITLETSSHFTLHPKKL